jgi:hypothetical protein
LDEYGAPPARGARPDATTDRRRRAPPAGRSAMEFAGPLSNPGAQRSLQRLGAALARSGSRPKRRPGHAHKRARPGSIVDSVVAVLAEASQPLTPKQVQARIEELLS